MKRVDLHDSATEEVAESEKFYDERNPELGEQFVDAVAEALERIGRRPRSFPIHKTIKGREYRKLVMKRFPFVIFFTEYEEYIWVPTVKHGSRDSDYWHDREPEESS
jgi:toxin ParE1/3/4